MVDEAALSSALCDLARTMLRDFPVERILDFLVESSARVLPISGAGATLFGPGAAPGYLAASSQAAMTLQRLQVELGQGPCLTAAVSAAPVLATDLAADDRYPRFGPAAVGAGGAAAFCVPLLHGDQCLGALALYQDVPGELDPRALAAAQSLAGVAAAYLVNARLRDRALETSDGFRDRSLHDALTGLPNRALLTERFEQAAGRARRTHTAVAALFVDLDHFKAVNDDYGHGAGDELLVAVAARLAALIRTGDTLARLSGDEFVFLCEDLADSRAVDLLAARIDRAFDQPFAVAGVELDVTASVGIAYAGPGEAVTGQLVLDADTAMYRAKRAGATRGRIDLATAEVARDRVELERDLRESLSMGRLDVAYQPIVRPGDGFVTGVEALLRWTHPERGPVPALTAVAVAERSGLIAAVGAWVLGRSCRDWVAWRAARPGRRLDLGVNVSPRQLMGPGFVDTVAGVLDATGMDPAALVLEVTEGIFDEDGERSLRVMRDLKALGVRLALDNFGAGYCSLDYLRRFPVDIVKIDHTFVADMAGDPAASAIVAAVTNLAHALDLTVTAEGVETAAQRAAVLGAECELAQGFWFARPMTTSSMALSLSSV